jgi:hypothetical protein
VKSFHALDYLGERAEEVAGASPPAVSLAVPASVAGEDSARPDVPLLASSGREAPAFARRVKDSAEEQTAAARVRTRPGAVPATSTRAPGQMPAVLRDDAEQRAAARRASRRAVTLGFASVVLLVLLGAQYAWFMPDDLLARFPQARIWLEPFCARTGCVLPHTLEPGGVEIVTRDVRIHPDYEGALLVNATLMNALPFAQPYPRIQFVLYNVNGETIAARTFEPPEYLARQVNLVRGMLPKVPVQAVLELLAVEQAAVSFEFRFL